MKNIAVMISGHSKGFDLTYQYFKHWNTLYKDINFDFFVSMWENDYDREKVFEWTNAYEILKEEDCPYDLSKHEKQRHQPHYSWSLFKVNELRNVYQDIKYDAIIQTRGDVIFSRKLLDTLVDKLTKIRGGPIPVLDSDGNYTGKSTIDTRPDPQLSDKNIVSANGSVIHNCFDRGRNLLIQNLWTQDIWFMGTPNVMDTFCNMFEYIFMEKGYHYENGKKEPLMLHIFQAEYLNKMGIYNSPTSSGNSFTFIRDSHRFEFTNDDGGYSLEYPSPNQIKRLIEDYGLDWVYDNGDTAIRWNEIQQYFKETEK